MKRIITTTSVFEPCTEMTGIIKRLAKLGYDGADIAFDYCTQKPDYPFMTDKYEDWAEQVRETAENRSITITHAHAPFDASATGEIVERTFRAAEIMGVKYIVAHPVWRRIDKTIIDHPDEFIETNLPLAKAMTAEQLLGMLAYSCGVLDENRPAALDELTKVFDWKNVRKSDIRLAYDPQAGL